MEISGSVSELAICVVSAVSFHEVLGDEMGTLQSCVLYMETGVTGGGIDGGSGSTLCRSYCCPWAK